MTIPLLVRQKDLAQNLHTVASIQKHTSGTIGWLLYRTRSCIWMISIKRHGRVCVCGRVVMHMPRNRWWVFMAKWLDCEHGSNQRRCVCVGLWLAGEHTPKHRNKARPRFLKCPTTFDDCTCMCCMCVCWCACVGRSGGRKNVCWCIGCSGR